MDGRDRALLAVGHQVPDRIPVDFWASPGFLRKLESGLGVSREQFMDLHQVDLDYIPGPEYIGPPLERVGEGGYVDIWGVPRTMVEVEVSGGVERYAEVARPPLASAETVEDILGYDHWPSSDWFDYSMIGAQCELVLAKRRAVVFMGDRLNRVAQLKPAMYLRGMEQILVDLATNADLVRALLGRIRRFYKGYLGRVLEAANGKIDIVATGDDFGAQEGLLVSPETWDTFLRGGFAEYVEIAKGAGAKVMHHTCGSVRMLIPRMLECGLDILQSLQPEARGMELAGLKAEFGSRLALHGGISVQRTLPFGSAEEIRAEVRAAAEAGGRGGGYIFCTAHNIQADTPVASVLELMHAYQEYGSYGGS